MKPRNDESAAWLRTLLTRFIAPARIESRLETLRQLRKILLQAPARIVAVRRLNRDLDRVWRKQPPYHRRRDPVEQLDISGTPRA